MVSLFGPGFDSPQLHDVTLNSLTPAGFFDLKVKATSSMTTPSSSTNEYKRLMDWMNIGATVLLVIIGIAIYIHKRKGEE